MVKKERTSKPIFVTGKRKNAVARASVKPGTGKISINSMPFDVWGSEMLRLWVKEPVVIAGDAATKVDIDISTRGGGIVGQAEAVRMAIARGIVDFFRDKKLRDAYVQFDRNLMVYDPRRNEPHKPSRSKAGPRRHKQRSKR